MILSNACIRIVVSANCGLNECSYDNYKNQLNILENDVSKLIVKEKIATKYSFEELFKYKLNNFEKLFRYF